MHEKYDIDRKEYNNNNNNKTHTSIKCIAEKLIVKKIKIYSSTDKVEKQ
jgi:hypothetical protein